MGHVNLAQVVFDRQNLSPDEDVALITMHWRGAEPGIPDSVVDMDEGMRGRAVDKIMSALNGVQNRITNKIMLREIRFYETAPPGQGPGPAISVYVRTWAGTAVDSPLPPQVACSVTWQTDKRKNWGRFYLPGLATPSLSPTGRFLDTTIAQIADAFAPLADRGSLESETLCVWSPTEQTHHDPQLPRVDDVPDVIRSRRFKQKLVYEDRGLG